MLFSAAKLCTASYVYVFVPKAVLEFANIIKIKVLASTTNKNKILASENKFNK